MGALRRKSQRRPLGEADVKKFLSAAAHGRTESLAMLLKAGMPVDARLGHYPHATSSTALQIAARTGQTRVMSMLIDAGANVEAIDPLAVNGTTPLMYAAADGHASSVELLLSHGADVKAKAENGGSVVHQILHGLERRWKIAEERYSVVDDSTLKDYIDTLQVVLAAYPSAAHRRDDGGRTALHIAAAMPHLALVKYLLDRGLDVNAVDRNGTPVVFSVLNQCHVYQDTAVSMLEYLMIYGADRSISNRLVQLQLLEAAIRNGNTSLVRYIITHFLHKAKGYDKCNAVGIAATASQTESVDLLINAGFDIDGGTHLQLTPLAQALSMDNADPHMIRHLIVRGADLNAVRLARKTALHIAVEKLPSNPHYAELVQYLLNAGAQPDPRDPEGRTPLFINLCHPAPQQQPASSGATSIEIYNVAMYLIQAGADVNTRLHADATSLLHLSAQSCNLEVFNLLRRSGADIHAVNAYGETVLHAAAQGYREANVRQAPRRLKMIVALRRSGLSLATPDRYGRDTVHTLLEEMAQLRKFWPRDGEFVEEVLKMYVREERKGDALRYTACVLGSLLADCPQLHEIVNRYLELAQQMKPAVAKVQLSAGGGVPTPKKRVRVQAYVPVR